MNNKYIGIIMILIGIFGASSIFEANYGTDILLLRVLIGVFLLATSILYIVMGIIILENES